MPAKTLSMTLVLVVGSLAGCSGIEPRAIVVAEADEGGAAMTAVVGTGAQILSSVDGSTREEVVFVDGSLGSVEGAQVVEIPEVIAAALAGAPASPSSDVGDGDSMILMSEDGSVQEEVVFTEPDDPAVPAASVGDESGLTEISLARIDLPERV
jgi:hypothetical protein